MKAASDHEVEDDPDTVFETDSDTFADTTESGDFLVGGGGERRVYGAEKEGAAEADGKESLVEDALAQGEEVGLDVGELGHAYSIKAPLRRAGGTSCGNGLRVVLPMVGHEI